LHGLGVIADRCGISRALEQAGERSRLARWGRSLFAIYRIDQMIHLDLPWWTFNAIERTDAFLKGRRQARVFEYGSGASTIWLARRAASVTSVEHDRPWYDLVKEKLAPYPHAQLRHVAPDPEGQTDPSCVSEKPGWKGRSFRAYVDAIESIPGPFDLIVIDGRARPACLDRALHKIAPDGMILFDNSHRPAYRRAIASAPVRASRTRGLTACLPYPDETTLLQPA
jgi:predicted O-methyltransferase YrrM